jgi:hypothetical protein
MAFRSPTRTSGAITCYGFLAPAEKVLDLARQVGDGPETSL